jgi:uncharacterized protein (UPF0264 family)
MTQLLVSVRSRREACAALAAGVDLIDIKDPERGSLGRADDEVIAQVVAAVNRQVPVSVALGELSTDWTQPSLPCRSAPLVDFAKIGLAGCGRHPRWPSRLRSALELLPDGCGRVAVAYVDWRDADAPCPEAVIELAPHLDCKAILFDTYNKTNGDLFHHVPGARLSCWIEQARTSGRLIVLAGSLTLGNIDRVLTRHPDYVAVRGAVCRGSRRGALDSVLLDQLVETVRRPR